MSVLVTGATGLVGAHLCKKLVFEGYDVIGLIHKRTNPIIDSLLAHGNFKTFSCDILDEYMIHKIICDNQVETVFHLAAHLPYTPNNDLVKVNIQGTLNMLVHSYRNSIEEFIYASSMSVYSTPPIALPIKESHPTNPSSIYGITKLAGEMAARHYSNSMTIIILRYAGVYGSEMECNRGVANFVRSALGDKPLRVFGDGMQSSDFILVDDVVDGTYLAWQKRLPYNVYDVYNIGSGQETRVLDLANLIINLTNSKSKVEMASIETDRPFRFVSDISFAREYLDYSPMKLEDGLRRYIAEEIKEKRN